MKLIDIIMAHLKGDDDTIKAAKIEKKAKALFKIQISRVENEILRAQDKIEDAKEAFNSALANEGSTEFSEDVYVNKVIIARQAITDAEDHLKDQEETLKFLKDTLASFDK